MKFSYLFTILCVLLVLQENLFSAKADQNFIENTCKGNFNYELCVEILLADPKSKTAHDITDLALIGVAAVKQKCVDIMNEIVTLKTSRPELSKPLDECTQAYYAVLKYGVTSAYEALIGGQAKFAEDGIADAAMESKDCEDSFNESGQTSPMTDSNNSMNDVANVVRGLIRLLL